MYAPLARPPITPRLLAAAVAGNAFEFYDFLAYAYFAVFIGHDFFPAESLYASLMASIAVFGVGFVFRPLGGLVIGRFADRTGRRPAMLLSLALASAGTLGIALTPTYARIGLAAPMLVVLCRVAQGLALGGEVGPATAFLLEIAPAHRRALFGSLQSASQFAAGLLATAAGLAISLALPAQALAGWGWRIPFGLAALVVPPLLILRRNMPETAQRGILGARPDPGRHGRHLAAAVLLIASGTIPIYVGVYMPTYAIATLHLPARAAYIGGSIGTAAGTLAALAGGWLADRAGRRPIMAVARVAQALTAMPAFVLLLAHPGAPMLALAAALVTGLAALGAAPGFALIPELLPRAIRAGTFAVIYALSVAIFGGTTQLIVTWAIHATGNPAAPAWYATGASLLGLIAIAMLPETRQRDLD